MKYTIIILILIIIGITTITISSFQITGEAILDEYTHTKAICNKTNFCQDYIITCKKNTLINKEPIPNAIVQHSKEWTDPRNNTSLC